MVSIIAPAIIITLVAIFVGTILTSSIVGEVHARRALKRQNHTQTDDQETAADEAAASDDSPPWMKHIQ